MAAAILCKLCWSVTFQELPPNLATLILTKHTAGRRGAAMMHPTALETKKVPRFPEITSIAQTIVPLDGKERSEVQNMLQSAALQSFNGWRGQVHMQLYKCLSSLSSSFCSWSWKLALHVMHLAFHFRGSMEWRALLH